MTGPAADGLGDDGVEDEAVLAALADGDEVVAEAEVDLAPAERRHLLAQALRKVCSSLLMFIG